MPEVGTREVLYLPTREEKDGQVILAAVSSQSRQERTPQEREFFTKDQKRIGLYPNQLFLEGSGANEVLSLEDSTGISIWSEKGISFQAEKEIRICGKKIIGTALEEVVCRTSDVNVAICRDLNFYAPAGVQLIGEEKREEEESKQSERREQRKERIDHWQISYTALGAIPEVDLSKIRGAKDIIMLYTLGSLPKVGRGDVVVSLAEVMEGRKEKETTFPDAFRALEEHVVTGGYELPDEDTDVEKWEVSSEQKEIIEKLPPFSWKRRISVSDWFKRTERQNVTCTNAVGEPSYLSVIIEKTGFTDRKEFSGLNSRDITINGVFSKCKSRKDGICILQKGCIEKEKWNDTKEEKTNRDTSYMICNASEGSCGVIYIPENGVSYKVPNSSFVPMETVLELLAKDLKEEEDAVNHFLEENHISLNFHQFDALVSFTHQYGEGWWSYKGIYEKQLPKFIRTKNGEYDPKEVEYVFSLHDYKERRAEEAEVFNNGYKEEN